MWSEKRVMESEHRRQVWSKGGSCIILCRKATKISRKQIKEDVNKHQRRACSSTLESFRGNEPEIVNGKSLLCFPLCLGKQALPVLASSILLPRREMSPASGWLCALLQGGAKGQPGHSFYP